MPHDETPDRLSEALDRLATANARDIDDQNPSNELIAAARFVQMLDRHDREPEPDLRFLQRLEQRLMSPASSSPRHQPAAATGAAASSNGHAPRAGKPSRLWTPAADAPAQRRPRGHAVPYLAAAAVLLVTLLAGIAAYRLLPSDGSRSNQAPSIAAAGSVGTATSVATNPPSHPAAASIGTAMSVATVPMGAATPDTGAGMFMGNAARTGEVPGPGPQGKPEIAWQQALGSNASDPPVVAGGRVFVINSPQDDGDYQLSAFDLKTGTSLWHAPLPAGKGQPFAAPAAAGDLVYAFTGWKVIAFQVTDGKVAWEYGFDSGSSAVAPAVADGLVYITVSDGTVRAIDAATGGERWRASVPDVAANGEKVGFNPEAALVVANGIVYTDNGRGVIYAFDAKDGHQLWTADTGGEIATQVLVADGTLVVTTIQPEAPCAPGRYCLHALDAATGQPRWGPIPLSAEPAIAAGDGAVYVAIGNPRYPASLEALDLKTGKRRWTQQTAGGIGPFAYADGALYVASNGDGTIRQINTQTGATGWSVYLNSYYPVVADGMVISEISFGGLVAVRGNGSPVSAAATPIDLSGIPACVALRPIPTTKISGTPGATLAAETKLVPRQGGKTSDGYPAPFTNWPVILVQNLPTGTPASPDDVAGILQTLRQMNPCGVRPETQRQLQGFFTDDFFRRGILPYGPNGYALTYAIQPDERELAGMRTVVLPDGRVAAIVPIPTSEGGTLFIFKQVDSHWLIDELYRMGTHYPSGQMG